MYKKGEFKDICCVPTSFQSEELIINNGLPLGDLKRNYNIDIAIDGADECDSMLNCIKGGGGAQLREKMVACNAKEFVVIADFRKQSENLGQQWKKGVPIAFLPDSRNYLKDKISKLGGTCNLRMAKSKMGPCVTDDGHLIFDVDFGEIKPEKVKQKKNKNKEWKLGTHT